MRASSRGVGRFGLHPERQLERVDAGLEPGIGPGGPVLGIEAGEQIELPSLGRRADVRMRDVLDQLRQVLMLRIDERPLKRSRQKARLPVFGVLDRKAAGAHRDEAGEVLVLGPQAVQDPGPDARPGLHRVAAVHQHQRRLVIGHLGVHRADDGDVVDVLSRAGENLAHLDPAFAVLLKLERRGERRPGLPLGPQRFGERLSGMFSQSRLRIERIDVRRAAVTEEVDYSLGLAGKVRRFRGERASGWRAG